MSLRSMQSLGSSRACLKASRNRITVPVHGARSYAYATHPFPCHTSTARVTSAISNKSHPITARGNSRDCFGQSGSLIRRQSLFTISSLNKLIKNIREQFDPPQRVPLLPLVSEWKVITDKGIGGSSELVAENTFDKNKLDLYIGDEQKMQNQRDYDARQRKQEMQAKTDPHHQYRTHYNNTKNYSNNRGNSENWNIDGRDESETREEVEKKPVVKQPRPHLRLIGTLKELSPDSKAQGVFVCARGDFEEDVDCEDCLGFEVELINNAATELNMSFTLGCQSMLPNYVYQTIVPVPPNPNLLSQDRESESSQTEIGAMGDGAQKKIAKKKSAVIRYHIPFSSFVLTLDGKKRYVESKLDSPKIKWIGFLISSATPRPETRKFKTDEEEKVKSYKDESSLPQFSANGSDKDGNSSSAAGAVDVTGGMEDAQKQKDRVRFEDFPIDVRIFSVTAIPLIEHTYQSRFEFQVAKSVLTS